MKTISRLLTPCPSPTARPQVQFDEREDAKVCTVVVNDDEVFEGGEGFHVELSMPAYALLGGNRRAVVTINDAEDEPTLQFGRKTFHVNESAGFLRAAIERTGEGGRPVCRLPTTNPYFGNPPPPLLLPQATPPAPSPPCAAPCPGRLRAAAPTRWSPAPTTRAAAPRRRTAWSWGPALPRRPATSS